MWVGGLEAGLRGGGPVYISCSIGVVVITSA